MALSLGQARVTGTLPRPCPHWRRQTQLFKGLDDTQSLTPLSQSTSSVLGCSFGTLGPHLNGLKPFSVAYLCLSHLTGGQITLGPLWPCLTLFPMQGAEIWNLLPITFNCGASQVRVPPPPELSIFHILSFCSPQMPWTLQSTPLITSYLS